MALKKEGVSESMLDKIIEEKGLPHLILCLRVLMRLRRSKKIFVIEDDCGI